MARTVGSNAADTRRRILESAAEVFAEHGYTGASMRDIAQRLGITKAALYYHFASKEELLDDLVKSRIAAIVEFTEAVESGRHSTTQTLRGYLDLTIEGIPGLYPLMADPGARAVIKTRDYVHDLGKRIEVAVCGDSDPDQALRVQFVLGGLRSMVIDRIFRLMRDGCDPHSPAAAELVAERIGSDVPLLSDAECDTLVQAALAALGTGG